ncbi:MAG: YfcC family protein [Planctomycetes bacterium]|nr:YfcC family protein [Planctomycetota bacterium]
MKLRAPNAFVLMVLITLAAAVLTWLLPGGEFERSSQEIPGYGQKEVVVPGSFREVESVPQGPWQLLMAPLKGFHDTDGKGRDAAEVVGFVLLIGGAFGVLQATGALVAGLTWIARRAGRGAGRYAVIPLLMFVFSAAGVLFGMAEENLIFVLITVPLAVALGFDTMTGVAIPLIGSQIGFATAFVNPFSFGIAKGIAQQEPGVGFGWRVLCWLVCLSAGIAIVLWHARRVARDPARSPTPDVDAGWRERFETGRERHGTFSGRHGAVLAAFGLSMAVLGYGAVALGWYIPELCALFLVMAIACGLAGGLGAGRIADSFLDGAKELAPTAVLIAFARAIFIVADDGRVVDTVLQRLAGMLEGLGPEFGTQAMFAIQCSINFFVPSGSGQAALTMPIMTPLADLLHIHRENAILAFQFGDGLTNLIIPTNPVLTGATAAAGIGFARWFAWMWKPMLLLLAVAAMLLYLSPFHGA